MYKIQSGAGRSIFFDEKELLHFSGTAYLGIPQNADFMQLLTEGLQKYGSNFGGSRLSSIRYDVFEEAENLLAKLSHAPAALTLSSGTLAGQLLANALSNEGTFFATPDAHPAMLNPTFSIRKLDNDWQTKIIEIAKKEQAPIVLFANALNSLQVQNYSFDWVNSLPKNIPFTLVVDDSHSLGICGENGGGIFSTINSLPQLELIVISSLGKAFGIPGGVILASKNRIQKLWESSLFGGASPALPAYLYAFVHAQAIYQENRSILFKNIAHFKANLPNVNDFQYIDKYPVFSINDDLLATKLLEQNIMISSFRYPSPSSPLLTRIVLSSLHEREDVEALIEGIKVSQVKGNHS